MIPFLQAENLSKRFGEQLLFEDISFTIFEHQKVAIIARNGAGKTTLMEILAGNDTPESGQITKTSDVRISYLKQIPDLNEDQTVFETVFQSGDEIVETIRNFELAVRQNNKDDINKYTEMMEHHHAWDYEVKVKQILTQLKIYDYDQPISELSGGQRKRVALANALISEPDLLMLDEPTNHLDLEMIEWLENYLEKTKITLFMVTHDRYFLDRVCNEILEMEGNTIYRHRGNYSYFLEKRNERIEAQIAGVDKAKNLLRTELEWSRRMPQARGTKSKYRMDRVGDLQKLASQNIGENNIELSMNSSRIGNKILDMELVSKSYGDLCLIKDFTYKFQRGEKVGIVGKNGTGKSTFLNIVTGNLKADRGTIEIGQTIRFGYYEQTGIEFDPGDKVIDAVQKIAEVINFEDGRKLTASQLLTTFLFPPDTQYSFIEKLSGGEKRRLYLCTILMTNPNFLILDEPTNDLDIMTLAVLEEYLRVFEGCVIIVSHDRYFMDEIVDHLFVFDGEGNIKDFPGSYSDWRNKQLKEELEEKKLKKPEPKEQIKPAKEKERKLSFNEKKEMGQLENDIEVLETEKAQINEELNSGKLDSDQLQDKSTRYGAITELVGKKEMRWLELSELGS
ncbi:MAG TPA: ABC-F family ATP-binding cassette domain-containing protein [Prolixibacteraceae bacterium]|nr:ABC-F family ATP-binding cassette domain-containing protein [Prolixibacteraceae bacterium]